ncbi:hypothetical protein [Kitasatospora sp. HPMI-4]|uniref:hypothetical protein n=1 Tax=Kitasatospora sp. HPMI-4 TaxID=3448443 RepID=UPI003F1A5BA6
MSDPGTEGVRDWRCGGCKTFGYTLPPQYAAEHPHEQFLQLAGGPVKVGKEVIT